MRPVLYVLSAVMVMGLAFWAYRQNYATQQSLKTVSSLQRQIGRLREELAMQKAEWAYENRPSRLRELTLLNFDKLHLLSMTPEQFGAISEIIMAPPGGPDLPDPTAGEVPTRKMVAAELKVAQPLDTSSQPGAASGGKQP
ncbi:MAG: cell division protein FtsL [Paracoccaceae bacterium]|nr:cell division protein FtsL [Paracoccaceae bacterium]MDE3240480.1 cell division protein FtsL [Paracoccaceae bacterium]